MGVLSVRICGDVHQLTLRDGDEVRFTFAFQIRSQLDNNAEAIMHEVHSAEMFLTKAEAMKAFKEEALAVSEALEREAKTVDGVTKVTHVDQGNMPVYPKTTH
jgi:hypothetical protein